MSLRHDLLHAGRMARLHRGFSAVVVAVVALGVGLDTAVFGLVDALLLRPAPVAAPARLVHVYGSVPGDLLGHTPLAFPDYVALGERVRSFAGLAAYAWYPLALDRGEGSELVLGEAATGRYFTLLGVGAARGRTFGELDDRREAPRVVVLSDDGWRRHFAAASDVVGGELRLNGQIFTVVGVTPPGFRGLTAGLAPDLWLPLHAAVALPTGVTISLGGSTPGLSRLDDRAQRWVWVTGRLRPGATVQGARVEVAAVAAELARDYPATHEKRAFATVAAETVRLLPGVDGALWAGSLLLMAVFASGLLLAAVNLASLFLARALGRRREIVTRLAIGASRRQLVRQLFVEGLVLALAGGGLGLLLASAANAALGRVGLPVSTVSWPLELVLAPELGPRVLGFALAAAVLTTVVFALLPALAATRSELSGVLREPAAAAIPSARRLRSLLVALQVAVSLVLLTGGAMAMGALRRATEVDPGFDPQKAAVVTLSPELLGYSAEEVEALFTRVERGVRALPGVRATAFASHLPLTAAINFGAAAAAGGEGPEEPVDVASVGAEYFATLGVELVAGRPFAASDGPGAPPVVIVNETLARRLWPGSPAVGRFLRDGAEVVGVARDGKYRTLGEPRRPFLYRHLGQDPRGTRTLVVRTAGDPRPLLPAIRGVVQSADPRVPRGEARTLAATFADALFVPRLAAALLGSFAALGLLLSVLGVAWVVAYLAGERTREIGLRLALGGSRGAILRWLLRRGLAPVAGGLLAGAALVLGAGLGLARVVGLRGLELPALAAAVVVLGLVATAAGLVPAWTAVRRDPALSLRHE